MQFAELALACVLHAVGGGSPVQACQDPFIQEVTQAVEDASAYFGVPPDVIAAVIYHESSFRQYLRGTHGEIGLMQPKPHGAIQGRYLRLPFKVLAQVRMNIFLGTSYLAYMQPRCTTVSGWLTRYNHGGSGGCASSKYSRGVLANLRDGRRNIGLLYSRQEKS